MAIYIVITCILLIENFIFYTEKNKERYKRIFWITIFFLALTAGFRSLNVGHDTANYSYIFSKIIRLNYNGLFENSISINMEKGYVLLCWIFGKISKNFTHFLIIISLFEFYAIGRFLWENSKKPLLSLMVFFCMFYTFFLTGIRQSIAMAILLLSFSEIKEKKLIQFIIKILLASTFHSTAVCFVIVYWLYNYKKPNDKFLITSLVSLPILFYGRKNIFSNIIEIFTRYGDYQIEDHGDAITYTTLLVLICLLCIFITNFFPIEDENEKRRFCFYQNMPALALMIMPLVGLNGALLRVAMYFQVFLCIFMVELYQHFKDSGTRTIIVHITITLLVILFFNELNGSSYIYEFVGWKEVFN